MRTICYGHSGCSCSSCSDSGWPPFLVSSSADGKEWEGCLPSFLHTMSGTSDSSPSEMSACSAAAQLWNSISEFRIADLCLILASKDDPLDSISDCRSCCAEWAL